MRNAINTSRRNFLKISAMASGGLMVSFNLYGKASSINTDIAELEINAFIIINANGSVVIKAKNPDIGQGVNTSLPMIVAEELDIPWEKVAVQQAGLDRRLGAQFTGGSTGVTTNYDNLRVAGAAARDVLIRAAANRWKVNPSEVKTENGLAKLGNKSLHYGELAEEASKLELIENPELKQPHQFKIIGQSQPDVDLHKMLTGKALYGIDQEIEGMVYATVLKPEVFGSSLESFDDTEARKLNGIIDIFKIEAKNDPTFLVDGIAIVANKQWTCFKAKKLIKPKWVKPEGYLKSNNELSKRLKEGLEKTGETLKNDGNVEDAFRQGTDLTEATYEVPFISHSQMEPMNFIADVKENSIRMIGPTQTPGSAVFFAGQITGIPRENINLSFTRIGGGFGRRLTNDYANEAVTISHRVKRPVKLVWDRENDFLQDYYRPAGIYQFKAAMSNKKVVAMDVHICTTSRYLYRGETPAHGTEAFPDQQPAGMIPNFRVSYSPLQTNVPVGALRTPGVNATTFAYQCFIDELAEKAGTDPIQFQLDMIGTENKDMPYSDHGGPTYNTTRLRKVIELVRDKSGWGISGKSQGYAGQFIFGTYAACIVDARQTNGKISIDKVHLAVDCGRVINPIGANAQAQGGITDAISAAFYESLELEDGKPKGKNFDTYQKLRMPDSPEVDVYFVDSDEAPSGLGEPTYPILFPALVNAVYKATGRRVRDLPLKKHNLV